MQLAPHPTKGASSFIPLEKVIRIHLDLILALDGSSVQDPIMIKAKVIPPGATVGIVTPAYPYQAYSDVEEGVAWWESRGYRVKFAEGALDRLVYTGGLRESGGTPERRANDLMTMFADPEVDIVQCLRGGDGASEIIPHIDFDIIARNPKAFLGFSNITHLHSAIYRFAGLATFYSPSLLGKKSQLTEDSLAAVLAGDTTGVFPGGTAGDDFRVITPGKASGRLMGGCLSDLIWTLGTPWEVDLDDAILVFEETSDRLIELDCALSQLNLTGKLDNIRGVVIGDLLDANDQPWADIDILENILKERLAHLGVPVIYHLPFGHGEHLPTLPLGVQATVDTDDYGLKITEPALI